MDTAGEADDSARFQTRRIENEHYDEELLVVDAENVPSRSSYGPSDLDTDRPGSEQDRRRRLGESERPYGMSLSPPEDQVSTPMRIADDEEGRGRLLAQSQIPEVRAEQIDGPTAQNSEEQGDSDELEEGSEDEQGDRIPLYDPSEYDNLPVGAEVKDLFKHIGQYTPVNVDLQSKLRPFVPEYLPAVGDIDGFVKVERPDGKPEMLGLTVLDEPCAKQSDPTVMDIQLRRMTKEKQSKEAVVHSIADGTKNPKAIETWIENIAELHRHKPNPTVNYSGPMPDVETLMKAWDEDYETSLEALPLPSAELDCDLPTYVDITCGLLDIPVHKSRVEALHVMFSLFAEFKNSQHFQELPLTGASTDAHADVDGTQAAAS